MQSPEARNGGWKMSWGISSESEAAHSQRVNLMQDPPEKGASFYLMQARRVKDLGQVWGPGHRAGWASWPEHQTAIPCSLTLWAWQDYTLLQEWQGNF